MDFVIQVRARARARARKDTLIFIYFSKHDSFFRARALFEIYHPSLFNR